MFKNGQTQVNVNKTILFSVKRQNGPGIIVIKSSVFVTFLWTFYPSLILVDITSTSPLEWSKERCTTGSAIVFILNIGQGSKCLPGPNQLTDFHPSLAYAWSGAAES
jgi:hypothetical protein